MRRSVGTVGGRQSGNELRPDLHQRLPRIGNGLARWRSGAASPRGRNLVSAGQIPVYGKPRVRRFRRDMLDLFLTNPDAAMRKFRAERNSHGS